MFDEINKLAMENGLVMSCCVDDMTFSGEAAKSGFLYKVRIIVGRYGLKVHKRHCFEAHETKIVTGVALTPKGLRLPNARRQKLHDAVAEFEAEPNGLKKIKLGERLLGRATEAAQIEEQFRPLVTKAGQLLVAAKQSSLQ